MKCAFFDLTILLLPKSYLYIYEILFFAKLHVRAVTVILPVLFELKYASIRAVFVAIILNLDYLFEEHLPHPPFGTNIMVVGGGGLNVWVINGLIKYY